MTPPGRLRDLLLIPLGADDCLVIACDAAGGVGPKPGDTVACAPEVVGHFTARVALMELLAAGATPLALVCTACVEPVPTGAALLAGVLAEAAGAGLPPEAITGSSEKNLPTCQTGFGVTAVGRGAYSRLRPGKAKPDDLVVAIGLPKVGAAVGLDDPTIADLGLVRRLGSIPAVHDLLPVGSRGIAAELADLAATAGLCPELLPARGWDLLASAGPATCLLAALAPADLDAITGGLHQPFVPVARLRSAP